MIKYILLDLDDTIYPTSTGLQDEINRKIALFVSDLLNIPLEEAIVFRGSYSRRYGSTLKGLLTNKQLESPEEYLRACHPQDLDVYLKRDPVLIEALSSLSVPLSILTNSPIEHARRVLSFLELESFFEHIFDIRFHCFLAKPAKEVYQRVLGFLSLEAPEVLFVDDRVDYLLGFRELGGRVVLVDEGQTHGEGARDYDGITVIRYVSELPGLLISAGGELS